MAFCFGTCATFNCVAAFGIRLNLRLEYIGLHGDSAAASDRYNTDSVLHNMHSRTSHRNALHNTDSVSHNMHSCTSHRTMHFITQTLCRTDAPHIAPALHNTDSVSQHAQPHLTSHHALHASAGRTHKYNPIVSIWLQDEALDLQDRDPRHGELVGNMVRPLLS